MNCEDVNLEGWNDLTGARQEALDDAYTSSYLHLREFSKLVEIVENPKLNA